MHLKPFLFFFVMGGIKNENTYTKMGRHSLSPHIGGFVWVTHHLHGVHLSTNIHGKQVKAEDSTRFIGTLASSVGSAGMKVLF